MLKDNFDCLIQRPGLESVVEFPCGIYFAVTYLQTSSPGSLTRGMTLFRTIDIFVLRIQIGINDKRSTGCKIDIMCRDLSTTPRHLYGQVHANATKGVINKFRSPRHSRNKRPNNAAFDSLLDRNRNDHHLSPSASPPHDHLFIFPIPHNHNFGEYFEYTAFKWREPMDQRMSSTSEFDSERRVSNPVAVSRSASQFTTSFHF